jgi:hypothetical protein
MVSISGEYTTKERLPQHETRSIPGVQPGGRKANAAAVAHFGSSVPYWELGSRNFASGLKGIMNG